MKTSLILLVAVTISLAVGCASMQAKRDIQGNSVKFVYPELSLKISDELRYEGTGFKSFTDATDGFRSKREAWCWRSVDGQKFLAILIDTLPEAGMFWAGTPNGAWNRDREYYRSFPETVERGGKNWYVDVIANGSWDRVVLGRYVGDRISIWLVYGEKIQDSLNWKELVDRAEDAVLFLP
jgi:hypothetical protein